MEDTEVRGADCLACEPSSQEPVESGWVALSSSVWTRVVGGLELARPDSTELDLEYLLWLGSLWFGLTSCVCLPREALLCIRVSPEASLST